MHAQMFECRIGMYCTSLSIIIHIVYDRKVSYANTANANTTIAEPVTLHTVSAYCALPSIASDIITRTMVSKLPTDVTIGPHAPSKI